ncbi:MAG: anti-sigma factor [Sphingopyxis sp.]|uniref:anti-sigma factor n=1 Tax=Sphingopyxis sp. TaxID=1908224 RepID=UPI0032EB4B40
MSFDPLLVAAYVDGEVDDLTARRIEREAESNAALAAAIARHRALTVQLAAHYAPVAAEPVPDRLRALLADTSIDTSLAERRERRRLRVAPAHMGAIAASLLLGLTIGMRPWAPAADVAERGGMLVASGELAAALDTQLAATQGADPAVRIGLSFQDRRGRICRSFEGAALSGIGCRDANGWSLERTVGGRTASAYRQAGSGSLAADAAAMMAGEPFDAAAERAARARGWE